MPPPLSGDILRHIQGWASFDTALTLAIAMNQPVVALCDHADCPQHLRGLLEGPLTHETDDRRLINMFYPLREYPVLWTMLPPARASDMLRLLLSFYVGRGPGWIYSKCYKEGNHLARACVLYLLKYTGSDAILRTLQKTAYTRLVGFDGHQAHIGDVPRTLLVHGSCRDETLKRLLHQMRRRYPNAMSPSGELAEIMHGRAGGPGKCILGLLRE